MPNKQFKGHNISLKPNPMDWDVDKLVELS